MEFLRFFFGNFQNNSKNFPNSCVPTDENTWIWKKIGFFLDISKHIYIVLETSKKFPRYPENLLAYFGNFQKKTKILICMDISMEISKKKPNCAYCKWPIFSIICLRQPNFLRTAYLLFNMNIAIAYCYCLFLLLRVIAIAYCLGLRYCLLLLPTVKHEYCYCLLPIAIA